MTHLPPYGASPELDEEIVRSGRCPVRVHNSTTLPGEQPAPYRLCGAPAAAEQAQNGGLRGADPAEPPDGTTVHCHGPDGIWTLATRTGDTWARQVGCTWAQLMSRTDYFHMR